MNECLKLGSAQRLMNVYLWVWPEVVGQGVIAHLLPFVHSRSAPRSRGEADHLDRHPHLCDEDPLTPSRQEVCS
jgi:hypothetical protein